MNIIDPRIQKYTEQWSIEDDPLLIELDRITNLKTLSPGMLTGVHFSQFLRLITRLMKAKDVLEIGTFTGYSSLIFAQSIPENGRVVTLESNQEVLNIANEFFSKSPDGFKIQQRVGDAVELLPKLEGSFDLVFIDGSKTEYSEYYDLIFDKIKPGGLILADNVLWYGRVVEDRNDPKTKAIRAFNEKISLDKRVMNILIPFGDGVNCILKL